MKIRFPKPLNPGDTIGVTAPSSGVENIHHPRLDLALSDLGKRGFKIVEGRCLRENIKHVSGSPKERARDLEDLWMRLDVKAIIPPWGGEFLIEILPLLNFEIFQNSEPKWVLGYSDISTFLFALTAKTGIASAHGMNLMDSILKQDDPLSSATFKILSTKTEDTIVQFSSEKYQTKWTDFAQKEDAIFNLTEPTEWKVLRQQSAHFSGRLLGGCLDCLKELVGTPFGSLPAFAKHFQNERVILFLENCDLSPESFRRALWNMRLAGWFENLNAVIFGRSNAADSNKPDHPTFVDAMNSVFEGFNFPVVYDADIGHRPPQMTLINGAFAQVNVENGKAQLKQTLK